MVKYVYDRIFLFDVITEMLIRHGGNVMHKCDPRPGSRKDKIKPGNRRTAEKENSKKATSGRFVARKPVIAECRT